MEPMKFFYGTELSFEGVLTCIGKIFVSISDFGYKFPNDYQCSKLLDKLSCYYMYMYLGGSSVG